MNILCPRTFPLFLALLAWNGWISDSWAQRPIAEIPYEGMISDIQAFSSGDSLFVAFEDVTGTKVKGTNRYYWIDSNGSLSPFEARLPDNIFSAVSRIGDDHYFYYLEGGKEDPTLQIVGCRAPGNDASCQPVNIPLEGRVVGLYASRNVYVLTYLKKEDILKLTEIRGQAIVSESMAKQPFDLADLPARQISFIPPESFVPIEAATSKAKIYLEGHTVTIVVDEAYEGSGDETSSFAAKTSIYRTDLVEGKSEIYLIGESGRDPFRTFLYENRLYRTINRFRDLELKVFDIQGKLISTTSLKRDDASKEVKVYYREGRAKWLSKDNSLFKMIKSAYAGRPWVVVERGTGGGPFICWGTYYDSNGGIVAGGPVSLATTLVVSLVGTAVLQLAEGPGISNYFYLEGDPEDRFGMASEEANIIRQKIDQYEIAEEDAEVRYLYKGYFKHGEAVVGIYRHKKKDSLVLVLFDDNNAE